jgi:hypothetical protein
MIGDLRDYLRSQIKSVDSDLVENDSAFYLGDIGETLIDRSYQIEINNIANEIRDSHREYTADVIISIFGYGYQDEVSRYDDLLDKAICIMDNVIELRNFSKQFTIVDIQANSINSDQLEGDDNGFKIDINLQLRIAYIRED